MSRLVLLLVLALILPSCSGADRPRGDDDTSDDDDSGADDDDTSSDDDDTSADDDDTSADDDDTSGDDDDTSGGDDDDTTPPADDDDSTGDDDDTTPPGDDDDATSGSCGTIGGWCTVPSDCGAGQTCYTFSVNQGVCNTDRTVCGGFVGASCADPAASICMYLPGSDYGLCANATEFDCICNGPAASNFPGLCFPIG